MERTRVRWGRLVSVAVVAWVGVALVGGRAGAGPQARLVSRSTHVVRTGETLWGIARGIVGASGDPRPVIDRLITVNHLAGGVVHPGDRLTITPP